MPLITNSHHKRLTAAELMTFDDEVTYALIDCVYYWTKIRKSRDSYTPCPRIDSEMVTSILHDAVRHTHQEAGVSKAVSQLIHITSLREFHNSLQPKKAENFRQHLRMYVHIYMPDCPFDILSTNRYIKDLHEATVAARQSIEKGKVIKYLCGIRVRLTSEENTELRGHFSIVEQTRNKAISLFLGPARFLNHDCAANAELMPIGRTNMEVRAIRDISIGEEIFVSYGDYFDEGNRGCLCITCEDTQRNGHCDNLAISSGNSTQKFESDKACGICHWQFPQVTANLRTFGCPNCMRHTNIYGLQWPQRRSNQHNEAQMVPYYRASQFSEADTLSRNERARSGYDLVDNGLKEPLCSTLRKNSRNNRPKEPKSTRFKVDKWYYRRRNSLINITQSRSSNLGNSIDNPIFIEDNDN